MINPFKNLTERASRRLCTSFLLSLTTTAFMLSLYQAGLLNDPLPVYIDYLNTPSIGYDCNLLEGDGNITFELKQTKYVNQAGDELATIKTRPILNCFDDSHEFLLESLRREMIQKPRNEPAKTKRISFTPEKFQDNPNNVKNHLALNIYEKVFKDQVKGGFFVEAGAMDCETDSVSLPFEQDFEWTGLLVEPNPDMYKSCLEKNRKANLIDNCLSTTKSPRLSPFGIARSALIHEDYIEAIDSVKESLVNMQCIPLYSILLAVDNPKVNLLILSVEGAEYQVLQTIPWDKVDIEVITVHTGLSGKLFPGSRSSIIEYLESNGYQRFDHKIDTGEVDANNDLFVRTDVLKKYNIGGEM